MEITQLGRENEAIRPVIWTHAWSRPRTVRGARTIRGLAVMTITSCHCIGARLESDYGGLAGGAPSLMGSGRGRGWCSSGGEKKNAHESEVRGCVSSARKVS